MVDSRTVVVAQLFLQKEKVISYHIYVVVLHIVYIMHIGISICGYSAIVSG